MKERVFRSVEDRAHGLFPWGLVEAVVAGFAGALWASVGGLWAAALCVLLSLGGLAAWRRADGRPDYLLAALRAWWRPRRHYVLEDAALPDVVGRKEDGR